MLQSGILTWCTLCDCHFLISLYRYQAGNVLAKAPFEARFNTPRQKEILWESLFNIDYVQRRRWRYSGKHIGSENQDEY